ncbi:Transposase ISSag8 [Streptococcus thermophilus]|nr:transposase ISSag8 [Streptococcus thermophilus TH1477]QIS48318.1 ISSth2 [Streptococcus thermophilus]SSC63644.1 Transposase ISSag8 [Streptococcus thermophilus]
MFYKDNPEYNRRQVGFYTLEELLHEDHFLRKVKETIERLFGTAKGYHNLRYTREKGKSKMEDKVGLTLAYLNIKNLVKMMVGKTCYFIPIPQYYWIMGELSVDIKKTNIKNDVCLHSEVQ